MGAARQKLDEVRPWVYDQDKQDFKCKEPGCAFRNADPQSVRLHFIKKHQPARLPHNQGDANATDENQPSGNGGVRRQPGHRHTFRLLRKSSEVEARAIQAGYTKVCTECDTLG